MPITVQETDYLASKNTGKTPAKLLALFRAMAVNPAKANNPNLLEPASVIHPDIEAFLEALEPALTSDQAATILMLRNMANELFDHLSIKSEQEQQPSSQYSVYGNELAELIDNNPSQAAQLMYRIACKVKHWQPKLNNNDTLLAITLATIDMLCDEKMYLGTEDKAILQLLDIKLRITFGCLQDENEKNKLLLKLQNFMGEDGSVKHHTRRVLHYLESLLSQDYIRVQHGAPLAVLANLAILNCLSPYDIKDEQRTTATNQHYLYAKTRIMNAIADLNTRSAQCTLLYLLDHPEELHYFNSSEIDTLVNKTLHLMESQLKHSKIKSTCRSDWANRIKNITLGEYQNVPFLYRFSFLGALSSDSELQSKAFTHSLVEHASNDAEGNDFIDKILTRVAFNLKDYGKNSPWLHFTKRLIHEWVLAGLEPKLAQDELNNEDLAEFVAATNIDARVSQLLQDNKLKFSADWAQSYGETSISDPVATTHHRFPSCAQGTGTPARIATFINKDWRTKALQVLMTNLMNPQSGESLSLSTLHFLVELYLSDGSLSSDSKLHQKLRKALLVKMEALPLQTLQSFTAYLTLKLSINANVMQTAREMDSDNLSEQYELFKYACLWAGGNIDLQLLLLQFWRENEYQLANADIEKELYNTVEALIRNPEVGDEATRTLLGHALQLAPETPDSGLAPPTPPVVPAQPEINTANRGMPSDEDIHRSVQYQAELAEYYSKQQQYFNQLKEYEHKKQHQPPMVLKADRAAELVKEALIETKRQLSNKECTVNSLIDLPLLELINATLKSIGPKECPYPLRANTQAALTQTLLEQKLEILGSLTKDELDIAASWIVIDESHGEEEEITEPLPRNELIKETRIAFAKLQAKYDIAAALKECEHLYNMGNHLRAINLVNELVQIVEENKQQAEHQLPDSTMQLCTPRQADQAWLMLLTDGFHKETGEVLPNCKSSLGAQIRINPTLDLHQNAYLALVDHLEKRLQQDLENIYVVAPMLRRLIEVFPDYADARHVLAKAATEELKSVANTISPEHVTDEHRALKQDLDYLVIASETKVSPQFDTPSSEHSSEEDSSSSEGTLSLLESVLDPIEEHTTTSKIALSANISSAGCGFCDPQRYFPYLQTLFNHYHVLENDPQQLIAIARASNLLPQLTKFYPEVPEYLWANCDGNAARKKALPQCIRLAVASENIDFLHKIYQEQADHFVFNKRSKAPRIDQPLYGDDYHEVLAEVLYLLYRNPSSQTGNNLAQQTELKKKLIELHSVYTKPEKLKKSVKAVGQNKKGTQVIELPVHPPCIAAALHTMTIDFDNQKKVGEISNGLDHGTKLLRLSKGLKINSANSNLRGEIKTLCDTGMQKIINYLSTHSSILPEFKFLRVAAHITAYGTQVASANNCDKNLEILQKVIALINTSESKLHSSSSQNYYEASRELTPVLIAASAATCGILLDDEGHPFTADSRRLDITIKLFRKYLTETFESNPLDIQRHHYFNVKQVLGLLRGLSLGTEQSNTLRAFEFESRAFFAAQHIPQYFLGDNKHIQHYLTTDEIDISSAEANWFMLFMQKKKWNPEGFRGPSTKVVEVAKSFYKHRNALGLSEKKIAGKEIEAICANHEIDILQHEYVLRELAKIAMSSDITDKKEMYNFLSTVYSVLYDKTYSINNLRSLQKIKMLEFWIVVLFHGSDLLPKSINEKRYPKSDVELPALLSAVFTEDFYTKDDDGNPIGDNDDLLNWFKRTICYIDKNSKEFFKHLEKLTVQANVLALGDKYTPKEHNTHQLQSAATISKALPSSLDMKPNHVDSAFNSLQVDIDDLLLVHKKDPLLQKLRTSVNRVRQSLKNKLVPNHVFHNPVVIVTSNGQTEVMEKDDADTLTSFPGYPNASYNVSAPLGDFYFKPLSALFEAYRVQLDLIKDNLTKLDNDPLSGASEDELRNEILELRRQLEAEQMKSETLKSVIERDTQSEKDTNDWEDALNTIANSDGDNIENEERSPTFEMKNENENEKDKNIDYTTITWGGPPVISRHYDLVQEKPQPDLLEEDDDVAELNYNDPKIISSLTQHAEKYQGTGEYLPFGYDPAQHNEKLPTTHKSNEQDTSDSEAEQGVNSVVTKKKSEKTTSSETNNPLAQRNSSDESDDGLDPFIKSAHNAKEELDKEMEALERQQREEQQREDKQQEQERKNKAREERRKRLKKKKEVKEQSPLALAAKKYTEAQEAYNIAKEIDKKKKVKSDTTKKLREAKNMAKKEFEALQSETGSSSNTTTTTKTEKLEGTKESASKSKASKKKSSKKK